LRHLVQDDLHAATVKRRCRAGNAFQSARATVEQQDGIAVHLRKAARHLVGSSWQGHESVLVALGVANMYACAHGNDVAHLQAQTLTQAQAEAVKREEEHAIAKRVAAIRRWASAVVTMSGRRCAFGGLISPGVPQWIAQNMGIVELDSVQVELAGAPRVRRQQIREVIRQMLRSGVVDMLCNEAEPGAGAAIRLMFGLGLRAGEAISSRWGVGKWLG
jgi:hypothetical protein